MKSFTVSTLIGIALVIVLDACSPSTPVVPVDPFLAGNLKTVRAIPDINESENSETTIAPSVSGKMQ